MRNDLQLGEHGGCRNHRRKALSESCDVVCEDLRLAGGQPAFGTLAIGR